MAIYCPAYDPEIGWHIVICGPNGPVKKRITSPLHYYKMMGVHLPTTNIEYLINEAVIELDEESLLTIMHKTNKGPVMPSPELNYTDLVSKDYKKKSKKKKIDPIPSTSKMLPKIEPDSKVFHLLSTPINIETIKNISLNNKSNPSTSYINHQESLYNNPAVHDENCTMDVAHDHPYSEPHNL